MSATGLEGLFQTRRPTMHRINVMVMNWYSRSSQNMTLHASLQRMESDLSTITWPYGTMVHLQYNNRHGVWKASVTSNHGARMILSPVRFLARKGEWSARRNFKSVLSSWSYQATGPVRLDTTVQLWFGWIIRKTPRVPWVSHRNLQWFHILRGPYGTRKSAARHPYPHVSASTQPELAKITHGRRIWPCGARAGHLRSPHGLFTGCLWSLNSHGARKLIMHALKLYGPVLALWVDVRFLFKTAREQPGSVMWLGRHATACSTICSDKQFWKSKSPHY